MRLARRTRQRAPVGRQQQGEEAGRVHGGLLVVQSRQSAQVGRPGLEPGEGRRLAAHVSSTFAASGPCAPGRECRTAAGPGQGGGGLDAHHDIAAEAKKEAPADSHSVKGAAPSRPAGRPVGYASLWPSRESASFSSRQVASICCCLGAALGSAYLPADSCGRR